MLNFKDLLFTEENEIVKVSIYKYFYKEFNKSELFEVGDFEIKEGTLKINGLDENATIKKFMRFFGKYKKNLRYLLNKNKVVYVDEDLALPLMGLNFLGISDKGSEMIEIKPITNCNIDCSFCSVAEGCSSKKKQDFVIDVDYLIDETNELLDFKQSENMSLWVNPHGEPFLYDKLIDYCSEMLKNKFVKDVHIVTNATLLNKKVIDELIKIQGNKKIILSVSLSSFSEESGKKLMGKNYNLNLVLNNLKYAKDLLNIEITPVWLKGVNDIDIIKIVEFAKENKLKCSIQKFCVNKNGRNPIKEIEWKEFFLDLKELEDKIDYKLTEKLEKLNETKTLPEIVHKNEIVDVEIVGLGRKNEMIGVIESEGMFRSCTVLSYFSNKKRVKCKVVKSKNNLIVVKCF